MKDLVIGGRKFSSRFFLGTGKFASGELLKEALAASGTELVTTALTRVHEGDAAHDDILKVIDRSKVEVMLNTSGAVLLGTAYSMLPFMILPIYSSMEKLDPALREAARDLGAGPLRSCLSVVLPDTLPGVMSGLAMTFVPSTGMFFISDLLGGGTNMLLGNLINNQLTVSRDWPFGAALSILMVGMTFCVMSLCRRVGGTDGTEVF